MAGLLATLLSVLAVTAGPAQAAAIPFSTLFATQDNGAVTLIGNSQMSCPTSAAACTTGRAAPATASAQSNVNDNDYTMGFLDADSDASTSNSTSADLSLPSGSTVLSAFLVWGGRRNDSSNIQQISTVQAETVKFEAPGASSYSTLTGTLDDPALTTTTDYNPYQGYYDVTSRVKAAGNGTYWVGDIAATTGSDRYAGWSLIVAYRNPAAPLRDLRIYNGFSNVSGTSSATINLSGFLTPASGTVSAAVGLVAWEGDRGFVGDGLKFNGTSLSDATRPATNFFNSGISDTGSPITARNPNYLNNLGVDIGKISATNVLSNNQTSTTLTLSTNGDTYYPGVITTQIDLFTPAFNPVSKSVVDLNGNSPAKVGDTLRYQISLTNTGADPADNSVISDALPPNTTYVPGSLMLVANPGSTANTALTDATGDDNGEYVAASRTVRVRVGQGASATAGGTIGVNQTSTMQFQVTLDRASAGTTVTNTSSLAYRAHTIGNDYTFVSNAVDTPVAALADLALTKTSTPATQNAGGSVSYQLTATNNGPTAATSVVITDTLPSGVTFTSASPPAGTSCASSSGVVTCTTGSLANGAALTVPIVVTIDPAIASGSTLTDVATVSSATSDDVPGNNTASASTGTTVSADVGLTQTASTNTPNAGSNVTYTITARNNGPSQATGVTVSDPLPLGFSYVSSTPGSTCVATNDNVTCTIGSLAPNASSVVAITAHAAANLAAGTITNTATVTTSSPDPNSANDSASVAVSIAASADLAVTNTAATDPLIAGTNETYTIAVKNNGPSDAAGVVVSDPAVSGLTAQSASSTQGSCAISSGNVSCAVGSVANGSTITITVVAQLASTRASGPLGSTATVTATTTDAVTGNNSSTATVTVTGSADLSLTKTADPARITPGDPVTYTLTVANNGPSQANGVAVTDRLPTGLTFTSGSAGCAQAGGTVTCTAATLASGATISFTVTADTASNVGDITNSATVSAVTADPSTGNNTAAATSTASPQADLSLTKSATSPVIPGQNVTYSLTIANQGPSDAATVVVTDPAPTGVSLTAVTATPAGFRCTISSNQLTCSSNSVPNGYRDTVSVTGAVDASATGSVMNTATIASATADPTAGNNSASVTSTLSPQADVGVTLTGPTDPIIAGTLASFQLQLVNNGPSTATGVVATGQVPPGMIPVIGSSGGACTVSSGTVTCVIGTMAPGKTITIPLKATADPTQPAGPDSGSAIVGATTPDPVSANNSSTVSMTIATSADLAVTKTVSPDPLIAGSPATYTIAVTNNGPSDAAAVTVSDLLDNALSVSTASPTLGSCTVTGQQVSCAAARLPAGETLTVTVPVSVASRATGTVGNTATAASSTSDPSSDNNSSTINTVVAETAHLVLSNTGSPDPVAAGAAVTYTLLLVNNGPSDATGVVLNDPLPTGTKVLSVTSPGNVCPTTAGATTVTCQLGAVAEGGGITVQVTAQVPSTSTATRLTNTATVTSPTPDSDPSGRTASADTDVVTAADLAVADSAVTDPVEAGGTQTYVLQINNNGPSLAQGVVVTDTLPAGATFVSATPSTGCTADGRTVTCAIGDVNRSNPVTLQIQVRLDPGIGGSTITNTASVASAPTTGNPTPDPNPANNRASVGQEAATRSDLSLTKAITSGAVVAGANVTYLLTATNNGPSNTSDLSVSDAIPASTTLVTATASDDGSCRTTVPVVCTWPAVGVGGARTVTLVVALGADTTPGTSLTNTATTASENLNSTPASATATATATIAASADLSLTKTLVTGAPVAGGAATWQLVVANAGPSDAQNVAVDDTAPAGVTFTAVTPVIGCTATAAAVHCDLNTVPSGGTVTVSVTGTLDAGYDAGSVSNSASVTSSTPDPDPDNNTATTKDNVGTTADLGLTATADSSPFTAGATVSWTLSVANAGPSTAAATVVTDVLPAGVSAGQGQVAGGPACTTADGTGPDAGRIVLTCAVGALPVGSPVSISVSGQLDPAYSAPNLTNSATVASTTSDPDTSNNLATATTPVTTSANLSLRKTGPQSVSAGQTITWTLTAANAGPSDALGGMITDTLPDGLAGISGSGPAGACTLAGNMLTCPVGVVAATGSAVVTVTATVLPSYTGQLINSATLTGTTSDPDPTDNIATTATEVNRSAAVSVTKAFTGTSAVPGQSVTWTLTATNAGPSDATDVTVSDEVPTAVTQVSARFGSAPTDCTVTGNTVVCDLGTLAPASPVVVTVTGLLAADDTEAALVNSATIASPDDPRPATERTSTSSTPVAPSADVSIGKALVSGPPVAGATARYVLTVGNAGPSDATGVVVTDQLPDTFLDPTISVSGSSGSCSQTSGLISCDLGRVPAAATPTITITGTFAQDLGDSVSNTAQVSADTADPLADNNSSTSVGSASASADLRVVNNGPGTATAGSTISWQVVVSNAGPSDAQAVTLVDSVPEGVTGAQASVDGTVCAPGDCAIGQIAAGHSVTVTITGTVSPAFSDSSLTNVASAAGSTPDPDGGNNSDTASTDVTTSAHLVVSKSVTPEPLVPGRDATYRVVVHNAGPSDARAVTATDALPDGLSLRDPGASASAGGCAPVGRTVSCEIGTVAANADVTITIPVTVDPAFAAAALTNTASVDSPTADPDPTSRTGSTTTEVTPLADLTVTKTGPTSVVAGQDIAWNILVSNAGPSVATSVVVTDPVPGAVGGLSASATQGSCTVTGHLVTCIIGDLAPGDAARITVVASGHVDPAFPGKSLDNTATVASSTPEPGDNPTEGRSSTTSTTVTQAADLSISNQPSPASFVPGRTGTWTLTVHNAGPSTATDIRVTDTVPTGLTAATYTDGDGNPLACPDGVCSLGTLAPDGSAVVVLTGIVDPGLTGTISNTAGVDSSTPDPDTANNQRTSTVPLGALAHLMLTKTGPATAVGGHTISWSIRVSNTGPSTARDVSVVDSLPATVSGVKATAPDGVTCSVTGLTLSCDLPDLSAADAAVVVPVTGTIAPSFSGTLLNSAQATTSTPTENPGTDNQDQVATTVTGSADLSITQQSPESATAGTALSWTLTVHNAGPSVAHAVLVTDRAPDGVTNFAGTINGVACDTPCSVGDLDPGQTVTLTYSGTVDPAFAGTTVQNVATVGADTPDPDSTNNSATGSTPVARSADLSIVKTVSPDPAIPGQAMTYTLAARNSGPSAATGVLLSDSLPSVLQNPTATFSTGSGNCALTGTALECSIASLDPNDGATVQVTGTLAADASPSAIGNTATVAASGTPDPSGGNNSSTVSTGVANADLSLTKTASAAAVRPGGTVTWTITASNAGPGPARGVLVSDPLPAGITTTSITPSQGTCNSTGSPVVVSCPLGTVKAGAAATVQITGTVSDDQAGALVNTATVTSPDDTDPSNNTASSTTPVDAVADLALTKTVTTADVVAGGPIAWKLSVRNAGPADAPNVVLTDPIPGGVGGITVPTGCRLTGRTVTCALGTVAAGATAGVVISGTIDPAFRDRLSNTASVTSGLPDPHPGNNSAASNTTVGLDSRLSVTKVADASTIEPGQPVTYTIVVTQAGLSASDPGSVQENFPSNSTFVSATASQGTYDSATAFWSVGSVAPGTPAQLQVTLTFSGADQGDSINSVTLTGTGPGVIEVKDASATVKVSPHTSTHPTTTSTPPRTSPPATPPTGKPPARTLPNTGFDAPGLSLLALVLLAIGAGALTIGRRRRNGAHRAR